MSCIQIIVCSWQVLNVGDHWITVTNKFSADPNVVYVYDSLHGRVLSTYTVVQLTSLLRQHVDCDRIRVVRRSCARQRHLSRLCGYFALAAAYAVCSGEDPTGRNYDSSVMVSFIDCNLLTESVDVVPHLPDVRVRNLGTIVIDKRHCLCHRPSATTSTTETMIECSFCRNWYHVRCVAATDSQQRRESVQWAGPCCSHRVQGQSQSPEQVVDVDVSVSPERRRRTSTGKTVKLSCNVKVPS